MNKTEISHLRFTSLDIRVDGADVSQPMKLIKRNENRPFKQRKIPAVFISLRLTTLGTAHVCCRNPSVILRRRKSTTMLPRHPNYTVTEVVKVRHVAELRLGGKVQVTSG